MIQDICNQLDISPNSTWLVMSRLTRQACHAMLFDKLNTAKMHRLETSNVSCRVKTWRDEPNWVWAIYTWYKNTVLKFTTRQIS